MALLGFSLKNLLDGRIGGSGFYPGLNGGWDDVNDRLFEYVLGVVLFHGWWR
jgi:hypothetical protein